MYVNGKLIGAQINDSASDLIPVSTGLFYFNTTDHFVHYYNATSWQILVDTNSNQTLTNKRTPNILGADTANFFLDISSTTHAHKGLVTLSDNTKLSIGKHILADIANYNAQGFTNDFLRDTGSIAIADSPVHTSEIIVEAMSDGTTNPLGCGSMFFGYARPSVTLSIPFSDVAVDPSDTFNIANTLSNGQQVSFSSSGVLPTGISGSTVYFVINATPTTFQISAVSGGSPVVISSQGTGTHSLYLSYNYTGPFLPLKNNDAVFYISGRLTNGLWLSNMYGATFVAIADADHTTSSVPCRFEWQLAGTSLNAVTKMKLDHLGNLYLTAANGFLSFSSNGQTTTIAGSDGATASVNYLLPPSGGAAGQLLQDDGTHSLVWANSRQVIVTSISPYPVTNNAQRVLLLVTTGASPFTVTLPASPAYVKTITVKKVDSGAGAITVDGNGNTIDGAGTYSLPSQYNTVTLTWGGPSAPSWYIENKI